MTSLSNFSENKVLHVVNISFVLPYYIGEQFDYFRAKGVKFYVACSPSSHLNEYAKQKKFTPVPVNILRQINVWQDFKAIVFLIRLIRKEKIDLVIGHTPKGALIAMISAFLAGVKRRVYFRHGLMFETSKGVKRTMLRAIERLTGNMASTVVCVSKSVLEQSQKERLNAPSKNIILNKGTCNGVDCRVRFNRRSINYDRLQELKIKYRLSANDRVIGFVGRLVNDKGINELIQSWTRLLKLEPNIKLLLVGPFEQRDSITSELRQEILNNPTIICTGLVTQTELHYALMDIFILPSYREGFPTVVLEASSMELPVLTTKATGCRDSIIEGKTGEFISLDPDNITKKILYYLRNRKAAVQHGINGRIYTLENFDQLFIWKQIEKKVLSAC